MKKDIETIMNLQTLSFNQNEISISFGILRTTLWRFLSNNHPEVLDGRLCHFSDDEIDSKVSKLKKENPLAGVRMIIGFLRSKEIRV